MNNISQKADPVKQEIPTLHLKASLTKIFNLLDKLDVGNLRRSVLHHPGHSAWLTWATTDPTLQALIKTDLLTFFVRFLNLYFWTHRYFAYGLDRLEKEFRMHHRKIVRNLCILYTLDVIKPYCRLRLRGKDKTGWCPVWVLSEIIPSPTPTDIHKTVEKYPLRRGHSTLKLSTS